MRGFTAAGKRGGVRRGTATTAGRSSWVSTNGHVYSYTEYSWTFVASLASQLTFVIPLQPAEYHISHFSHPSNVCHSPCLNLVYVQKGGKEDARTGRAGRVGRAGQAVLAVPSCPSWESCSGSSEPKEQLTCVGSTFHLPERTRLGHFIKISKRRHLDGHEQTGRQQSAEIMSPAPPLETADAHVPGELGP